VKKKTSMPLDQVIKKIVTFFNRSGTKRAEPQWRSKRREQGAPGGTFWGAALC